MTRAQQDAVNELKFLVVGKAKGQLSARARPTPDQLAALQASKNVTAVVTLLLGNEGRECGDIERTCNDLGLRWCHAPIEGLKDIRPLTPEARGSFCSVHKVADWL